MCSVLWSYCSRRHCYSLAALLGSSPTAACISPGSDPAILSQDIPSTTATGVSLNLSTLSILIMKPTHISYRIELKSPLYTHFIESLAGVTTIRAFSWTQAATSRMISMLDTAQRPYYLLLCIQRWLSLVLNLIVAAIAALLVGASVALRTRIDSGLLGIALVMMMDLGLILSELIQNWTLLETSLGAISRIKEFSEETPNEESNTAGQSLDELTEWPTQGEIAFVDVSITWNSSEKKPLLDSINLRVGAGEKFGLCGRTGR
jgi:ATP-binding cassette subfamily C (CFTR/MRP) protein 1